METLSAGIACRTILALPPWASLLCAPTPLPCAHDSEGLSCVQEEKQPLKEGVQDMLVKHHLFSWDIDG